MMVKKIVVAGSRRYNNYDEACEFIDLYISRIKNIYKLVFVSGGCTGADMLGERFANENGFAVERIVAEWEKYGKRAGPIRNEKMALAGDYIICFWDGKSRGTKSMIEFAIKLGKPLKVKIIRC